MSPLARLTLTVVVLKKAQEAHDRLRDYGMAQ
jgi:hypothetical protein